MDTALARTPQENSTSSHITSDQLNCNTPVPSPTEPIKSLFSWHVIELHCSLDQQLKTDVPQGIEEVAERNNNLLLQHGIGVTRYGVSTGCSCVYLLITNIRNWPQHFSRRTLIAHNVAIAVANNSDLLRRTCATTLTLRRKPIRM